MTFTRFPLPAEVLLCLVRNSTPPPPPSPTPPPPPPSPSQTNCACTFSRPDCLHASLFQQPSDGAEHESLLASSDQGSLAILDASFKFARSSCARTVVVDCSRGAEKRYGTSCVSSGANGVCVGLMSASVPCRRK